MHPVALHPPPDTGRLMLRDRDRAALLQRLSTQDLTGLVPGQGARSVLTNHNGRIIDLFTFYALPDAALVVTGAGNRATVLTLLRKNIFFNDQLKIDDATEHLCHLAVSGPQAQALLHDLGAAIPAELPRFHHVETALAGTSVRVAADLPLGGPGFAIFAPAHAAAALTGALLAAGAVALSPAEWDVLRVEHGYGVTGRELSLEYIPLETGLLDAVSFTKGCYVGQEIIARMESRNRLARRLMGLQLSAPVDLPATRTLLAEGRDAGDLTSAVVSPVFGPIGLGYVRTGRCEPGTALTVAESDISATVVELPFRHEHAS